MSRRERQQGVALVIILSALVLVSVIVMAFFSRASSSRLVASSSAAQYRAETMARTGLETILGDLRTEIVAGSETPASTAYPIYLPLSNATVVPFRAATELHPNVIKRSISETKFWAGSNHTNANAPASPVRAAKNNNTATASRNGRYVDTKRWNAPYLLGETLPADFVAPDWVIITREGALAKADLPPAITALSNADNANLDYAVGRYAYMIYNEGGLLDVNVAGYPNNMNADFRAKRGLLPQVDLGLIPGILDADAIVRWRNQKTVTLADGYVDHVFKDKGGFMVVPEGDQTFVSRQDLIKYAEDETHKDYIKKEALQYLGTFTRELNAPSYTPDASRPKVGASDDAFNPSLINTPVTTSFTRQDGTVANIGEPLIKSRFPLSRLGLITSAATATTSDPIYKYFGLTRSDTSAPWLYRGGASRILKLDEVAAQAREPDFFELLQAAIVYGSLGNNHDFETHKYTTVSALDANTYYQVIQIGANLIDQYDADSYPTRIKFDSSYPWEFCGVENLPYLTRVFPKEFQVSGTSTGTFGVWLQPEVWNPHAQAATPSSGQPPYLRFHVSGTSLGKVNSPQYTIFSMPNKVHSADSGLEFPSSRGYSQPTYLNTTSVAASGDPADIIETVGSTVYIGVNVGKITLDMVYLDDANVQVFFEPQGESQFELQFSDDRINWFTYDRMRNATGVIGARAESKFKPGNPFLYYLRSDPRSDRFGPIGSYIYAAAALTGNTIRPVAGADGELVEGIFPGLLADNLATSATTYPDKDGVTRPGEGAYASAGADGYPMATGNLSSRPMILNRPFRSVADMGYASRGMPWKNLDFFHSKSGDAALLDLFCLNESPVSAVVAGKVDLNTKQQPVLMAALAGAIRSEENNQSIPPADADTYAAEFIALTGGTGGPLKNNSELVSRWMDALPTTAGATIIKRQREASVRALADVGNTRTWNLMIDIIAQSGRYSKSAVNLNEFTVDGERRYWLHVAIDRYTGKVISEYPEPVYE